MEAEALPLGSHLIGSDKETRIIASGSLIIDLPQGNAVYNAEAGGGAIELTELNAVSASGSFLYRAKQLSGGSQFTVGGEFDVEF